MLTAVHTDKLKSGGMSYVEAAAEMSV